MAGGLILQAIKAGAKVSVVCLTSGDQGKIHIHGRGRSLGEIRQNEFFTAVKRLGVGNFETFNFPDGQLKTIRVWDSVVAEYVRRHDVVVSYDPSGVTGHPDHIALSLHLIKLARKTKFNLFFVAPIGIIRENFLDPRVIQFVSSPDFVFELTLWQRLRKWWAFYAHRSQYPRSILIQALFFSFLPQSEGYAIFNSKKKYLFKYINFDF